MSYPSYFICIYITLRTARLKLGSNDLEEARGVGTDELGGLLAVLEDDEGGHGADAELLGEVGKGVDVELGEVHLGLLTVALELLLLGPPLEAVSYCCFTLYEAEGNWLRPCGMDRGRVERECGLYVSALQDQPGWDGTIGVG